MHLESEVYHLRWYCDELVKIKLIYLMDPGEEGLRKPHLS